MAWAMESDLNPRSESNAGRVNVNDSATSAGGSLGPRMGFGTEYDTHWMTSPIGQSNPSLADTGSEQRPQPSGEAFRSTPTLFLDGESVQFGIDGDGLFTIAGVEVADDLSSSQRPQSAYEGLARHPPVTPVLQGGVGQGTRRDRLRRHRHIL